MRIVQMLGMTIGVNTNRRVSVGTQKLGDIIMEVVDAGLRVEAAAISLSLIAHVEDNVVILTEVEFNGDGGATFSAGANHAGVEFVDSRSNHELRLNLKPTTSGMEVNIDEQYEDNSWAVILMGESP